MNAQRLAFLESLESDLIASKSPESTRSRGIGRKVGAVGATLFATASFFALASGGGTAMAAEGVGVQACPGPDPEPRTQYKGCGSTTQKFEYQSYYNPVPHIVCYRFDAYMLTCNMWYPSGHPEACTR